MEIIDATLNKQGTKGEGERKGEILSKEQTILSTVMKVAEAVCCS